MLPSTGLCSPTHFTLGEGEGQFAEDPAGQQQAGGTTAGPGHYGHRGQSALFCRPKECCRRQSQMCFIHIWQSEWKQTYVAQSKAVNLRTPSMTAIN